MILLYNNENTEHTQNFRAFLSFRAFSELFLSYSNSENYENIEMDEKQTIVPFVFWVVMINLYLRVFEMDVANDISRFVRHPNPILLSGTPSLS